jgi:hypothetical protein
MANSLLPRPGEPVPAPCQDCEGTGRAICKACCGAELAPCWECGQDRDCPACGGTGRGKDLCAVCHGERTHGTMPGPVDLGIPGWQLDGRYHALIAALPNVLWTVAYIEDFNVCVAFRFVGGEGLAMLKCWATGSRQQATGNRQQALNGPGCPFPDAGCLE